MTPLFATRKWVGFATSCSQLLLVEVLQQLTLNNVRTTTYRFRSELPAAACPAEPRVELISWVRDRQVRRNIKM